MNKESGRKYSVHYARLSALALFLSHLLLKRPYLWKDIERPDLLC